MLTTHRDQRQVPHLRLPFSTSVLIAAGLVALTAGLRLWHIGHGLPDFLEEAIPFKRAFAMWGWETGHTDLNPHFFNYPTLAIYLHFLLQKIHYLLGLLAGQYSTPSDYWLLYQFDPTPQVILARLVGVFSDCATVLGVWVIGERLRRGAGLVAAVLLACNPTFILTGRSIYTDSVMTALATWAVERMLAFQRRGGGGRLAAALVLTGLAAGAKYTAGLLILPLAWILWTRYSRRGLLWWPVAATACGTVFLLASPFVLLDFAEFWHDFNFERQHMETGHLGTLEVRGAGFLLTTLTRELGIPSLLGLGAVLVWILWRRNDPAWPGLVTLGLVLLPQSASVGWFRMEAARYLLPVLPAAALLIAWGWLSLVSLVPFRRRRPVAVLATVLVVGLVLQPAVSGGLRAAATGADHTQQQARRWCTSYLPPNTLLVQESYTATLRDDFELERLRRHPAFANARPEYRHRLDALPVHRTVQVPMIVSGQIDITIETAAQRQVVLPVFAPASMLNRVFYTPALYLGVDYFITSGAIRQRYENNPTRFPQQVAFYEWLDAHAEVAASFAPGRDTVGPLVTVHDLRGTVQELVRRQTAGFTPYWWVEAVPLSYRLQADSLLAQPAQHSQGQVRRPDGRTASWVLSLTPPFNNYLLPFSLRMAHHLTDLGRYRAGRHHAAAILAMRADLPIPCFLFSICAANLGDWDSARRALETSIATLAKQDLDTTALRFRLARVLAQLGEDELAGRELETIARTESNATRLAQQARRLLAMEAFADSLRASP